MATAIFLPQARNYIKKLVDKKLKKKYQEAVEAIKNDYTIGTLKSGDLVGIYSYDIFYNKTNYELAYKPIIKYDTEIIVIMAGTRENFYEEMKNTIIR